MRCLVYWGGEWRQGRIVSAVEVPNFFRRGAPAKIFYVRVIADSVILSVPISDVRIVCGVCGDCRALNRWPDCTRVAKDDDWRLVLES